MRRITRDLAPVGFLLALAACAPIGGITPPSEPSAVRPVKYRAMILSTVSSGLQVGSQSNVQPQTQIGTNTQQLFVFVFGNNNVVTVDQTNLMPFLNLNWVNQAMDQTQVAGDVNATSNSGSLQWDPSSLSSLLGASSSTSPSVAPSHPLSAGPSPTPMPTVYCPPPAPTATPSSPSASVQPTPTRSPTVTPTGSPSADTGTGSDTQAMAAAFASLTGLTLPETTAN